MLLLTPLEKALKSLTKAFIRAEKKPDDELIRDGTIQRFEYTFELAWKITKRKLEQDDPNLDLNAYSKKDLFRQAGKKGLIQDVEKWFNYQDKRNLTSHTYDQENAKEVFSVIGDFIKDVGFLLEKLKQ